MNDQPIEKPNHDPTGDLEIHSIFLTIQGEGPFVGHRAIFVRLAGCNLQCPMCDTDYTSVRTKYTPDELVSAMKKIRNPGHLVVITGGEPFRQNLAPSINALLTAGYEIQIETNGTLYQDLPYDRITVVCSPKTGQINRRLLPEIAALKYVVAAHGVGFDGLPLQALGHTASPYLARPKGAFNASTYIQPEDSKDEAANKDNLTMAIKGVMEHGYILGLQVHKIINME